MAANRTPKEVTAIVTLINKGILKPIEIELYRRDDPIAGTPTRVTVWFLMETDNHIVVQEVQGTGWYSQYNLINWTRNYSESWEYTGRASIS